jgi:FMN phosphatase YigB (HAD superfamily)
MREFPEFDGPMYLWEKVEAVAGVAEAIPKIREDMIIALATNSIASQESEIRKALDRVGLNDCFDKIFCFTKIGIMKPSRRFFDYIINDLGRMAIRPYISSQNLVMVGDDFEKDIKGANKSGIFGIWLNENSGERKVGKMFDTINSMAELPEAIARRERMLALK